MTDKRNLLVSAVPGSPGRYYVDSNTGAVGQTCRHTEISSLILAYARLHKVNTVNVTFCFGEKDAFWDNFQLAESLTTQETKKEPDAPPAEHELVQQAIEIVDQQLNGVIDASTARSAWYAFAQPLDDKALAQSLTFAMNRAIDRAFQKAVTYGIGTQKIPVPSPAQLHLSETVADLGFNTASQLHDARDLTRAHKCWQRGLEALAGNSILLAEIVARTIADIRDRLREDEQR